MYNAIIYYTLKLIIEILISITHRVKIITWSHKLKSMIIFTAFHHQYVNRHITFNRF
jgi:hypothetical protein